jgi:GDPmannose 4,6-dehydratase
MLEAYRTSCPKARFYQASSSEMFGSSVDDDGFQRETTRMNPVSPYGCTKVFGYNIVRNYRNAYNLFATNGILFNHESPRRGSNFVTNKVVKGAVRIKLGLQDKLEMGNMDSFRDWGHSKDYVRAMHMIMNHDTPDDFVVATGECRSVREMSKYVFSQLGLNYEDYIVQNPKYLRPEELPYLKGDCSKIKNVLGWNPEYTFEMMMDEMIEHWLKIYSK